MKHSIYTLLALVALLFSACEMDEIDTAKLTDFAPGLAYLAPADGGKIVKGNFDITAAFADGMASPLASVNLALMDASENELFTTSANLSGTRDTLKVAAADFNAAALEVGVYTLKITVTDSKGQVNNISSTFEISKLPFAANNDEMYIAGGFNGWSWDSLKLVEDHIWEIKEIELDGGEWKFKNTKDWSDADWGDSDCDGVMEVTTGGGANTNCSYSGLVNIRFNDNTLQYTVEPAVTLEQNVMSLYLHGTFNNFQGDEYAFTQSEDHVWVLEEVVLKPGDSFKFSEGAYSGRTFGDVEPDSIADKSAPNIVLPQDIKEGVYKVTFNDETLAYSLEFVRNLFPDNLYLVGSATSAGWDPSGALQFNVVSEGKFEIFASLVVGEFKFLQERDWAGDWGKGADGEIIQEGESNIAVDADGLYRIVVDFNNYSYTVATLPAELYLVGGSTSADWDPSNSVKFVKTDNGKFQIYTYLTVDGGGFKFLQEQAWDGDWGKGDDGMLKQEGEDNVTVGADGFYRIDVDYTAGTYAVTASNWGIIGSATPAGWDADTDMTLVAAQKGNYSWTIDATLTDGELKFRENDGWDVNFGDSGADGTLDAGGDNIAVTAGTYTITMTLDPINGYTYSIK
ncbi:SusF/SusE family outer membrane protein [Marinoscillum furvescens]|uniref:Uncharacterized protein DUF5019 n=1 Tax=Marinoscillum furvescens DSM 4134 TaxID=1122208 RepID=A0A3D9L6C7_MARFU|nr:SusF/SusE family outer membrane protein [Marinoscillum furvescens]REE01664.1 uncharacterized protein DUF5019 [Marinoscillum furvescens DSM 4134]